MQIQDFTLRYRDINLNIVVGPSVEEQNFAATLSIFNNNRSNFRHSCNSLCNRLKTNTKVTKSNMNDEDGLSIGEVTNLRFLGGKCVQKLVLQIAKLRLQRRRRWKNPNWVFIV